MMSKFVSLYGHDKAVSSRQPDPPADSGPESAGEERLGGLGRGHRQPAVQQRFAQVREGYLIQLDQVAVVASEVLDGEQAGLAGREDRFLLRLVGGPEREDRAPRRRLGAKALEVGLAERAFPGERLARHVPGTVAAAFLGALGYLGQFGGQAGDGREG